MWTKSIPLMLNIAILVLVILIFVKKEKKEKYIPYPTSIGCVPPVTLLYDKPPYVGCAGCGVTTQGKVCPGIRMT